MGDKNSRNLLDFHIFFILLQAQIENPTDALCISENNDFQELCDIIFFFKGNFRVEKNRFHRLVCQRHYLCSL